MVVDANEENGGDDELESEGREIVVQCGSLANLAREREFSKVDCSPKPDPFNPCEDILSNCNESRQCNSFLRYLIWLVMVPTLLGNLAVILVLGSVYRRLTVPRFLQLNLALGDFFMGVYLLMLATADRISEGEYFNWAMIWQEGTGCKLAGASSLFASQLSIYTLSVITFERYFTITYSIDLNKRLQLNWATRIMLLGWLYALASAFLPIIGDISSYELTSICLPLRASTVGDRIFVMGLILIKALTFIFLLASYLRMYNLIIAQKSKANFHERRIAKRMALLVLTDFVCYAPIVFFALTAYLGLPLISLSNAKIFTVLFYPLNSVANPYLYVISTRQFKCDLRYLGRRIQSSLLVLLTWATCRSSQQLNVYIPYGDQMALVTHTNKQNARTTSNSAAKNRQLLSILDSGPGYSKQIKSAARIQDLHRGIISKKENGASCCVQMTQHQSHSISAEGELVVVEQEQQEGDNLTICLELNQLMPRGRSKKTMGSIFRREQHITTTTTSSLDDETTISGAKFNSKRSRAKSPVIDILGNLSSSDKQTNGLDSQLDLESCQMEDSTSKVNLSSQRTIYDKRTRISHSHQTKHQTRNTEGSTNKIHSSDRTSNKNHQSSHRVAKNDNRIVNDKLQIKDNVCRSCSKHKHHVKKVDFSRSQLKSEAHEYSSKSHVQEKHVCCVHSQPNKRLSQHKRIHCLNCGNEFVDNSLRTKNRDRANSRSRHRRFDLDENLDSGGKSNEMKL